MLILTGCGKIEKKAEDYEAMYAGKDPEVIYKQACGMCHGMELEGDEGPALTHVGNVYTKEEIEEIILKGKSNMKAGYLVGEPAEKVAEWLAEMKQ